MKNDGESSYASQLNAWDLGSSNWRTEEESCTDENRYEGSMDGNENKWNGKDDRDQEKSNR